MPRRDPRHEGEAERLAHRVHSNVRAGRTRGDRPLRRLQSVPGLGPSPPESSGITVHALFPALRVKLEAATGYDLSDVLIVRGPAVDFDAEQMGAVAFTHRGVIHAHEALTEADADIFAHEVAHVIQQRGETGAGMPGDMSFTPARATDALPFSIVGAFKRGARWVGRQAARGFWWAVRKISPQLERALRALGDGGLWALLSEWLQRGIDLLLAPVRAVAGFFAGAVEGVRGFLDLVVELAGVLPALLQGSNRGILGALRRVARALRRATGGTWSALFTALTSLGRALAWISRHVGRALDFLFDLLGDAVRSVWNAIKWLAAKIAWVFDKVAGWVWDRICGMLGFDGGNASAGGVIGWIQAKVSTLTGWIESIVASVASAVAWLAALGPIRALADAIERATALGDSLVQCADACESPTGPAEQRDWLRESVLPAIQGGIASLREVLRGASAGVITLVSGFATGVAGFMAALQRIPLLGGLDLFEWLGDRTAELGDLAVSAVRGGFALLDTALATVSDWVEPVWRTLEHVAGVVLNAAAHLPQLVLGRFWRIIPSWIRRPLRSFIVDRVLKRIPLLGELITRLPDMWQKAVALFGAFVSHVFRRGDLVGALWQFFRGLLALLGVPVRMIAQIVLQALRAIGSILRHPFTFLINLVRTIGTGLGNFVENLWQHLRDSVTDWILGELKTTRLILPREFSAAGVFSLVTQLLRLTSEHFVEMVRRKRGDAAAAAVRVALQAGTAAVGWITTLARQGPLALWNHAAAHLSDLWSTLLNRVEAFVLERVMATARRWLLALLDVTGIMAAIRTGIAVYRAIESFIANLHRIFAVIHAGFTAMAEIAAGNVLRGAGLIEQAAARALTVLIAFLANQLGLGRIADRLVEILDSLRRVVLRGLERMVEVTIDPLLAGLRAGAVAVRKGVSAALAWLGLRRAFVDASGDTHELYFAGSAETAELHVASTPRPLTTYLEEYLTRRKPTPEERAVIAQIRSRVTAIEAIKSARGTRGRGSFTQTDGEAIRDAYEQIVVLLSQLRGEDAAPPPTRIAQRRTLAASGDGTELEVAPLSLNPGGLAGGQPFGESPLWLAVSRRKRRAGGNTFYVRGHLLNHHLHGAGSTENMIPITNTANGAMERLAETHLKSAVLDQNRVVRLRVEAVFGSHGARRRLPQEAQLPTAIAMEAQVMQRRGKSWQVDRAARPLLPRIAVPNELPAENEGVIATGR